MGAPSVFNLPAATSLVLLPSASIPVLQSVLI